MLEFNVQLQKCWKFSADAHRVLTEIRTMIFTGFMAKLVRGGHEIMDLGIQVECGPSKCQYFFEICPFC